MWVTKKQRKQDYDKGYNEGIKFGYELGRELGLVEARNEILKKTPVQQQVEEILELKGW